MPQVGIIMGSTSDLPIMQEAIDILAGFDIETAVRAGHYGLLGMRERVRLLHGSYQITSKPKQGTHLHVILPLEAA